MRPDQHSGNNQADNVRNPDSSEDDGSEQNNKQLQRKDEHRIGKRKRYVELGHDWGNLRFKYTGKGGEEARAEMSNKQ